MKSSVKRKPLPFKNKEREKVHDGLNITTIDPHFILISYDIKGRQPRRRFRETILSKGAVYRKDSEYYCLWSLQLYKEMKEVVEFYGAQNFNLDIFPAAFTDEDAALLKDRYEIGFLEQFEEAGKKLDFIRDALAQDILREDSKTGEKKPYTAKNLVHIIGDIEHSIQVIEKAMAKRKEIELEEWKLDEQRKQHFELLEKRIEGLVLRAEKYSGAIRAQAKREDQGFGAGAAVPMDLNKL